METNAYFLNMKKVGQEWEAKRIACKQRGEDAPKIPFSHGEIKAYTAWAESVSRENDELELSDTLWDTEIPDFIATLRAAGIRAFNMSSRATNPMGIYSTSRTRASSWSGHSELSAKRPSGPMRKQSSA